MRISGIKQSFWLCLLDGGPRICSYIILARVDVRRT